jgi:hypothetical protein
MGDPGRRERELYSSGTPGLAAKYVRHFPELMSRTPPGQVVRVVLFCRVSEWCQHRRGHDADQELDLKLKLARRFGDRVGVVGCVRCVGPGWQPGDGLAAAVSLARQNAPGTIVLAETPARLLRHRLYHSVKNPDVEPNEWQWRDVMAMAKGVILACMVGPGSSPAWIRRYEAERGMRRSQPGAKKEARRVQAPQAKRLRDEGLSIRDIGLQLGRPYRTVGHWLQRWRNGTGSGFG